MCSRYPRETVAVTVFQVSPGNSHGVFQVSLGNSRCDCVPGVPGTQSL